MATKKSTVAVESASAAPVAETNSQELILTPEEMQAILDARSQNAGAPITSDSQQALANALITAIEATRPAAKKTVFNRKKGDPWQPKDGSAKLKLRRIMYQHGLQLDEKQLSNAEIDLLNQVKPGLFCDGNVRVIKRRDKSIDIEYAIKTASQRLKLVNNYGVTNLSSLLRRLIDESKNPKQYVDPDDDE